MLPISRCELTYSIYSRRRHILCISHPRIWKYCAKYLCNFKILWIGCREGLSSWNWRSSISSTSRSPRALCVASCRNSCRIHVVSFWRSKLCQYFFTHTRPHLFWVDALLSPSGKACANSSDLLKKEEGWRSPDTVCPTIGSLTAIRWGENAVMWPLGWCKRQRKGGAVSFLL